jgi:hypothetical protein
VQLHELLGQRQAESRALLLASVLAPHLAELLEDGRLVLGRDADPRVADGDRDGAVGRRGGEADPATLRGELHRVGKEVQQDLLHLPLVRHDVRHPGVHGLGERDPVPGRSLPDQGVVGDVLVGAGAARRDQAGHDVAPFARPGGDAAGDRASGCAEMQGMRVNDVSSVCERRAARAIELAVPAPTRACDASTAPAVGAAP